MAKAMNTYLFCFGYEDPVDFKWNSRTGEDVESSTGVFVDAVDEAAAMEWGIAIAEAFLARIFDDPEVSWKERNYAYWIEKDPQNCDWTHCLSFFQRVPVGTLPDLNGMTTEAYVEWEKREKQS